MKKLLALCLTAILAIACLASCFGQDEGLTYEKYENCAVFTFDDYKIRTKTSIELDRTDLGAGVIYYQVNLEKGALSVKYTDADSIEAELLSEFTADDEMPIGGSDGYIEGEKITITFESFSPVSGEIIIAFTEDALKAVRGNLHKHEHTREMRSNEYAHWYVYTCGCETPENSAKHSDIDENYICDGCDYVMPGHEHIYEYYHDDIGHSWSYTCGCKTPPNFAQHFDGNGDGRCGETSCEYHMISYSISYDGKIASEILMDGYAPTEAKPGNTVQLRAYPLMDADLVFYANGVKLIQTYADSDFWEYIFTMPDEDVVITHEIVGDGPAPINHFLRNQAGCEWLNEISAEDIAEIKIIGEAVGVGPGNLKNISSSTDEAVIAIIFEEYYWLDTAPISKMDGQIDGGSGVTVKFILKDGTVKDLYINNGNYLDTNGNYFELYNTPKFKDTDNATKAYGFITYIGTGTVYDKENNPVCEIPTSELEFVESDGCVDAVVTGYYYTVETEFGTLWFDYSNDLFYLRFDEGEVNYREYYQLVGKNLDELIAEYSTTTDQDGFNDIFYAAAYPEDFEYNGRHYRIVQGDGLKTTVTQEELGELLGYIIREEDVPAFTQEHSGVDYVIDNGIYDYDTNNRVAFYSIKAYPDLSIICMRQGGSYILFHDVTDLLA